MEVVALVVVGITIGAEAVVGVVAVAVISRASVLACLFASLFQQQHFVAIWIQIVPLPTAVAECSLRSVQVLAAPRKTAVAERMPYWAPSVHRLKQASSVPLDLPAPALSKLMAYLAPDPLCPECGEDSCAWESCGTPGSWHLFCLGCEDVSLCRDCVQDRLSVFVTAQWRCAACAPLN